MYQITITNDQHIREEVRLKYFMTDSYCSRNLTLKEASNLIHIFKFIKVGSKLYNRDESQIVGSIRFVELGISNNNKPYTKSYKPTNTPRFDREIVDVPDDLISLHDLEKLHIIKVNEFTGNKTLAAKILGITFKTLYNKIEYHNITWKQ